MEGEGFGVTYEGLKQLVTQAERQLLESFGVTYEGLKLAVCCV